MEKSHKTRIELTHRGHVRVVFLTNVDHFCILYFSARKQENVANCRIRGVHKIKAVVQEKQNDFSN